MQPFDISCFKNQGYCVVDEMFTRNHLDGLMSAFQEIPTFQGKNVIPLMNPHKFQTRFSRTIQCSEII